MRMRERVALFIVFLFLVAAFVNFNIANAEEGAVAGYTFTGERTVLDMAGRQVKLPEVVKRIVTTYKSATQFVFALGAQERLVAVDIGSPRIKLFTTLMPEIKKLPTVGSKRHGLNLEEIISTRPDLVILFPYGDGPEVARKLKQHGIASIIIKPESLAQIKETNLLLGKALNLEERAQRVDQEYKRIMQMARELAGSTAEKKMVYFANSELLDTVGRGMLQTSIIESAGGINPASRVKAGFIKTSPEELIKWNPDMVIVSQFFQGEIGKLLQQTKYQTIKAFKEGKIYRIPSNLEPWDHPSPSSYLAIIWLGQKLYPDKFSESGLAEVVNHYYTTLYGRSYTELGGRL